eukprot:1797336-Rhodomonas_salina.2
MRLGDVDSEGNRLGAGARCTLGLAEAAAAVRADAARAVAVGGVRVGVRGGGGVPVCWRIAAVGRVLRSRMLLQRAEIVGCRRHVEVCGAGYARKRRILAVQRLGGDQLDRQTPIPSTSEKHSVCVARSESPSTAIRCTREVMQTRLCANPVLQRCIGRERCTEAWHGTLWSGLVPAHRQRKRPCRGSRS